MIQGPTGSERATALVAGRDLRTGLDGGALVVELPAIDLFEVIRVRHAE